MCLERVLVLLWMSSFIVFIVFFISVIGVVKIIDSCCVGWINSCRVGWRYRISGGGRYGVVKKWKYDECVFCCLFGCFSIYD